MKFSSCISSTLQGKALVCAASWLCATVSTSKVQASLVHKPMHGRVIDQLEAMRQGMRLAGHACKRKEIPTYQHLILKAGWPS